MNNLLLDFTDIEEQASAIVEALKEKMQDFGYREILYRLDKMDLDEYLLDVVGFSFCNEAGELITPGFFKFPDCFEKPYDTVERFSDLVIYLVSNEIAIRLEQDVQYCYLLNEKLYKQEEMSEQQYEQATLISHVSLSENTEDGLYGCVDGLWLVENGSAKKMTLFDVCSLDTEKREV